MAEDPLENSLNSLQDDSVRPPTVPNIDSKRVAFDNDITYFYSHDDDDDDSIREKIKASVPKATSDHNPNSNPNTESIPSKGESTGQVDYCHMPSDVLRDLSVICCRTDISNTEKWSMYCKMMQSYDHLSENQKKQCTEESKWAENSPADSDTPEMFSFLCSVQCKKPNSDDGRRLAVITRLKKRMHSLLYENTLRFDPRQNTA